MKTAIALVTLIPFTLTSREYTLEKELYNQQVTEHIITDEENRITERTDYFGNTTHFTYTGTTTQMIDPLGNITLTEKTPNGKLTHSSIYDAQGQCVTAQDYTYSAHNNLLLDQTDHCYAQGKRQYTQHLQYQYNLDNQLTKVDFGNGETMHFQYEEGTDLRKQVTFPDGRNFYIHHDPTHPRFTSDDKTIDYQFHHCKNWLNVHDKVRNTNLRRRICADCGTLTKEELPTKHALALGYTATGKIQCIKLNNHGCIHYIYDENDNLTEVQRRDLHSNVLYSHKYTEYDSEGNILNESLPFDLGEVTHHIDFTKKTATKTTPYFTEQYTFDPCGNVVQVDDETYTYDAMSQFTGFDSLYNPLDAEVNEKHQVLQYKDITCTYDAQGNLATKETPDGITHYTYDFLNHLTQVQQGDQTVKFTYDPFGRRMTKAVWNHGKRTCVEHYVYYRNREIAILRPDGSLKALRLIHPEREETLAIEMQGRIYVPLHDQQNNLRELIDVRTGQSACTAHISPFGDQMDFTFHIQGISTPPWVFSGKHLDPETSLIYFGKRYYDPALRRWLSPDPMGTINGNNLYAYALNNPLRYSDPDGTFVFVIPICTYVIGSGFVMTSLAAVGEAALWSAGAYVAYRTVDYLNFKREQASETTRAVDGTILEYHETYFTVGNTHLELTWKDFILHPTLQYNHRINNELFSMQTYGEKKYEGDLPNDPTQPPGDDWKWKGDGPPGSSEGNWVNEKTKEWLHPDLGHGPPFGPHWDYGGGHNDENKYRICPDTKKMTKK